MHKLCLAVLAGCAAADAARPNILFLMADQMRFDVTSRNAPKGYAGAGTPNLDRLADEGANFAKSYASVPSCTPARASILTGMRPWKHGMIGYSTVAKKYPVEMVESLAAAGYTTHSVGKDHFGFTGGAPNRHGYGTVDLFEGLSAVPDNYTTWFADRNNGKTPDAGWPTLDWNSWRGAAYALDEYSHPTAWTQREAVKLINTVRAQQDAAGAAAKPFFVKVSWHRPHSPYSPPQRLLDTVQAADLPPYHISKDGWDAKFGNDTKGNGCGPSNPDAWCGSMPEDDLLLARRAYYAEVRFVDEAIGAVLAAVDTADTLVVFTADHGDSQGDHYHYRKTHPFEGSAHVPMIVRWPESMADLAGQSRGQQRTEVTELRDLLPTFFDVAGIDIPAEVDGASMLCALDPSRAACGGRGWRAVLDSEHSACYNTTTNWNALTDGRMKYIWNGYFDSDYLFNLTADPYEQHNLAGTDEAAKWRAMLVNQFEEEGRGGAWVKDGKLVQRSKNSNQPHSPNYPGTVSVEPEWYERMYVKY